MILPARVTPSIRTFGKYLLDDEIARGGMSRVYSARLRGVGGFEKRLVVKQVLPELARDPRFVSMFVHEAKTLVQMSHPHIAPVFELGVVDGVYFLAMEYVEGATLAAILADGPLAPELAAHLGAEVCDALHYAHARFDIVHRDVTPRNVIVDGAGHSRLLDFGIAAPLSDEDAEIFGTPGYLSPEQIAGRVEPASDVFSLGAVLFEALTGRRAFEARTVEESERALATGGPAFSAEDRVDPPLESIVLRALARDPTDRFRSARDLGRALRGWLASTHPEGVAPELGLRAERAEGAARRRLSHAPGDDGAALTSGDVRTIATSRALDALIGADPSDDAGAAPPRGAVDPRGGEASRGTVPIERPRPQPAEPGGERDDEGGDDERPDGRDGLARERAEREDEHAHGRRYRRERRSRGARLAWLAGGALVVAVAVAFAWAGAPRAPEPIRAIAPAAPPVIATEAPPAPTPVPEAPAEAPATPAKRPNAPAPRPATVPMGTLSVNASPWAELELDGRALGRTPQRRIAVRPGRHSVVLRCPPLGREVRYAFEAEPGRPLVIVADLTVDPPVVRRR